jgi:hypothetical protein
MPIYPDIFRVYPDIFRVYPDIFRVQSTGLTPNFVSELCYPDFR